MGFNEPNSLKFNLGEIQKMKNKIQMTAKELQTFNVQLNSEIDTLKKSWVTPAGRDFFSSFDVGWSKQVDQYVKILNAVDELLTAAHSEYSEVKTEAEKLKF